MAAPGRPTLQPPAGEEVVGDALRDGYSCAADDGAASEKKREASMLFCVAEGHLEAEDYDEALSSAGDALAIFREIEDLVGLADALRLVVHAYRGRAEDARLREDPDDGRGLLSIAEDLVREELDAFRSLNDKRGEAAMLLSIAELNSDGRAGRNFEEALDAAEDSLALFGEVGDVRMEATACFVLSLMRFRGKQTAVAKRAGNEAVALFRNLGDKKREAMAWGGLASIAAYDFCYEEAVRCGRKQLKLLQEIGHKRPQASVMHTIARAYLSKGDAASALSYASQALALLRESDARPARDTAILASVVDAHIQLNNTKKAIEIAGAAVDGFRESGDSRQLFRALHNLAVAHQVDGDFGEAVARVEEALALCRELGMRRSEAQLLESLAYLHVDMQNAEEAKRAIHASVDALREEAPTERECKARMFGLARILIILDDYPAAAAAADEALRLARELGDRCLEGQAMLAVAATRSMTGDFEKSVKAGELAAEIFHEVGGNYRIDEAKCWQNLAETHLAIGEVLQALRAILQAEALLQDFGDKRRLAKMKHSRVRILLAAGDAADATRVAMEALKINRSEDDVLGTVDSLLVAIQASVEALSDAQGEGKPRRVFQLGCEKALRLAKEVIGISIRTGDKRSEGGGYQWVAHLQVMCGRLQEARQAAESALALYREAEDKSQQAQALAVLARVESYRGDSAAAIRLLSEAMGLAQESKDRETIASMADAMAQLSGEQAKGPAAPTLDDLTERTSAKPPPQLAAASGAAVDAFSAPDRMLVRSFIQNLVQNMTGTSDEIDGDTPLMESGIDSLASVELRTQLQQEFRLSLPSTVMFNYPTISTMTQLLVDECTTKKISWGG